MRQYNPWRVVAFLLDQTSSSVWSWVSSCLKMMCGVGKDIGRACDFLGIWVEVCSPPTKGTTGDDLVLAGCHELHVAPAVIPTVPVNELDLVALEVEPEDVAVLFRPFHTAWVAENIEVRIVHDAFDISYGPLEITPVDLFSRTSHIENVALISR